MILSLVLAGAQVFAAPVDRIQRRDELIAALHEIHRGEHLGINAGEVVEYAAMSAQALVLVATGGLAIVARHPAFKKTPEELALLNGYLDSAVKHAPTAFVASASLAILAGVVANLSHAREIMGPIDVRTEEGFAEFLKAPLWRQIQIAEADVEFEDHLIEYAKELRDVREDFSPRKN